MFLFCIVYDDACAVCRMVGRLESFATEVSDVPLTDC